MVTQYPVVLHLVDKLDMLLRSIYSVTIEHR